MFEKINIILVNTSHPGNIGGAARAMKTMGFSRLTLVSPKEFPHEKALEMASGATDILEKAIVVQTLDEAIAHSHLVIATSARNRALPWPLLTPRELKTIVTQEALKHDIAIVFGRERTGLTNSELQLCHFHLMIPADENYASLNLAAAVQVLTYELRLALQKAPAITSTEEYPLATPDEMQRFFTHLESALIKLDFLKMNAPRKLMPRLRRLFLRTRPDKMEINLLRGILTAIEGKQ